MGTPLLGEFAALATACCWAATAMAFESAGRRIGSLPVNLIRLVIGFLFLVPVVWVMRGRAFPTDASADAWLYLSLSGLVGFAFGDLCLFRAFVLIGSRLSVLVMSLVPPLAALLGWFFLGETLTGRELTGMALTVGGVAWVVRERIPDGAGTRRPSTWGVVLALGGAVGQAGGLILSKKGMAGYDAFAANQIRVLAGIAGFAVIFTASGLWPRVLEAVRQPAAMSRTAFGAFFGPFLGVSFSLVAVAHSPAGVAATIMAIAPVILLPATRWRRREPISLRTLLGALVALAGTAVLFS
ncbi:DMT family transporter [bacterium]|nr:DMT family transporter [bacterium]